MNNKITQPRVSLKISREVVVKTAQIAASEIKGVCVKDRELYFGGKKERRPIKVSTKDGAVQIDISIMLTPGYKALQVAAAVQREIKAAVQNMSGVAVSKVNVCVIGIYMNEDNCAERACPKK
ncbi:MAG: Asp23/Gls24 family envelope stress response protein [Oscillospiraceae bacterium]|nr:Asp23/Gls24 family envelope stress response protein [Oscillospiraceae bacterium]